VATVLYASFDEVPSHKGASAHILAICRGVRQRHALHLLSLGQVRLTASGFVHHPQHLEEPNYLARAEAFRRRLEPLLDQIAPALVHVRSPWEGLPVLRRGLPMVYEVNGLPSVELPESYPRLSASLLETLRAREAQCVAEAKAIVCPSLRIRDFLVRERAAKVEKIRVLQNGYDPVPSSKAARQPGPLRLVYLGTHHPWQGLGVALRAMPLLRHPAQLEVIGPPHRAYTIALERSVRRLRLADRVTLTPPLNKAELAARLSHFDVGLAPLTKAPRNTEQGCCPVKILDYLAHGLPVVASDLYVVRQLLAHDDNALLVPPEDPETLAAALDRLAADPALRRRLRDGGRASLSRLPTWDDHARGVLEIYDEVLEPRSAR
jgi:glycosyltransferase involved in cell wall biosynthesis